MKKFIHAATVLFMTGCFVALVIAWSIGSYLGASLFAVSITGTMLLLMSEEK
jgi:hypothetical protein